MSFSTGHVRIDSRALATEPSETAGDFLGDMRAPRGDQNASPEPAGRAMQTPATSRRLSVLRAPPLTVANLVRRLGVPSCLPHA